MKKIILVFLILCVGILIVYSIKSDTRQWEESFAGGTHLILSPIDKSNIKQNELINKNELEIFERWLIQKSIDKHLLKPLPGRKILVQLPEIKYGTATKDRVEKAGMNWQDFSQRAIKDGLAIHINEEEIALTTKLIIRVPEVINEDFVKSLNIFQYAPLKELLSVPSLELKLVKKNPQGKEVSNFEATTVDTKKYKGETFSLFAKPLITSRDVTHADVSYTQFGLPAVKIQLNKYGTKKFAELTQNNIGKRLAVIYEDSILLVPVIREPILNGEIQITGDLKIEEVENIVLKLNLSSLLILYEISEAKVLTKKLWAGKK